MFQPGDLVICPLPLKRGGGGFPEGMDKATATFRRANNSNVATVYFDNFGEWAVYSVNLEAADQAHTFIPEDWS